MILTRAAEPKDATHMCDVLNPLIEAGGTTAHRVPFDAERMVAECIAPPRLIACTVAEEEGVILGFQSVEWGDAYGIAANWAVIATFVRFGLSGRGIGTLLFAETKQAARAAGAVAIDATIRRENTGGLTYYSRLGFVDYRNDDVRISKRYDLAHL